MPDGLSEAVMKGHRLSQSLDVYAHHRVSSGQSRLKEAVMAGPRSPENTGVFFVGVFSEPTHMRRQLQENPHPGAFRKCERKKPNRRDAEDPPVKRRISDPASQGQGSGGKRPAETER